MPTIYPFSSHPVLFGKVSQYRQSPSSPDTHSDSLHIRFGQQAIHEVDGLQALLNAYHSGSELQYLFTPQSPSSAGKVSPEPVSRLRRTNIAGEPADPAGAVIEAHHVLFVAALSALTEGRARHSIVALRENGLPFPQGESVASARYFLVVLGRLQEDILREKAKVSVIKRPSDILPQRKPIPFPLAQEQKAVACGAFTLADFKETFNVDPRSQELPENPDLHGQSSATAKRALLDSPEVVVLDTQTGKPVSDNQKHKILEQLRKENRRNPEFPVIRAN